MDDKPERRNWLRWPSKSTWGFVARMVEVAAGAASAAVWVYTAIRNGG
jgi:hypothetical protein